MLAVAIVSAVAVAVLLASGSGAPGTSRAQDGGAGMSLGAEGVSCNQSGCRVAPKSPFILTVNASPPPDADIAGFGTEVVFGGLTWLRRPGCQDEVQVVLADGRPVAICQSAEGPVGQARHAVVTAVQAPPLPAVEPLSDGDTLMELDVECPAEGTYTAVLTAASGGEEEPAPFGAFYAETDTTPVIVDATMMDVDLDGDTSPQRVPVADTLKITCAAGAPTSSLPPPGDGGATTPAQTAGPTLEPDAATAAAATSAAQTAEATALSDADATATAAAATDADGEDDDDGGVNPFVWVIIGVVAVAAAGGLGFLGWRWYQRRGQGQPE